MVKRDKAVDRRVEHAFYRVGTGVQIGVMDLPQIMAAGRKAVAAGVDDAALDEAVRAAVAQFAVN